MDFVIATMRNQMEIDIVVKNLFHVIKEFDTIIIVAINESDVPDYFASDKRINLIYRKPNGGCQGMHEGFLMAKSDWVCFLNDDIEFADKNWLSDFEKIIKDNPNKKLFSFDDYARTIKSNGRLVRHSKGRWIPFGVIDRLFYLKYWQNNPYKNFGWDNEVKDVALMEDVLFKTKIRINHFVNLSKRDKQKQQADKDIYISRRGTLCR